MRRRDFLIAAIATPLVLPGLVHKLELIENLIRPLNRKPDDEYRIIDQTKPGFRFENGDIILTKWPAPYDHLGSSFRWQYIHASVVIGEDGNQMVADYSGQSLRCAPINSLDYVVRYPAIFPVLRTTSLKPDSDAAYNYFLEEQRRNPWYDYLSFIGLGPEFFKFRTKNSEQKLVTCVGFIQNALYAGGLDVTQQNPVGLTAPDNFIGCPVYWRNG